MQMFFSFKRLAALSLGTTLLLSSMYLAPASRYAPSAVEHAEAATLELLGYAWSDTTGWISVNCANTSSCGTSDYKLVMDTVSGNVAGFAWSDNVGWIEFGGNAASGCPAGTCQARKVGDELRGWARLSNGDGMMPPVTATTTTPTPTTVLFSTPTTGTSFVVPAGVTSVEVKAWGAGGGSGGGNQMGVTYRRGGGGGYATMAAIPVTPGESLTVQVGAGGSGGSGANCGGMPGGAGGAPGGSAGGTPGGGFQCPTGSGGGGGGYSGIFRGAITQPNALIIAGGGAGGGGANVSYAAGSGGAGGGLSGVSGGGAGGTQISGAAALAGSAGGGGLSFGGGGGAGGYFGGAGGGGADNANSAGGGGGSGRLSGTGTLTAGSGVTPANTADALYPVGVGVGAAPGAGLLGAQGGRGHVVITYMTPVVSTSSVPAPFNGSDGWVSLSCANSGTCGTSDYTVDVGSSELSGYAWGSDVVGWISFNCSNDNSCATSNYRVYFNSPCAVSNACSVDHTESVHTDAWCTTATTTCSAGYICKDADGLCGYGDPSGTLSVSSGKVRRGSTVNVSWSSLYASVCTVAGTNGDSWSPASSSAQVSAALNNEVTYTLSCEPVGGGTPVLLDTERVTLIPAIKEF